MGPRGRRDAADLTDVLRIDSLEIGLSARRVWMAGRDVELTAKEFDLLLFFIERDELDIYNIPITKITNDFLDFIHQVFFQ